MINFARNNLDQASSPYLKAHQKNPIHWQQWNTETLEYAKMNEKLPLNTFQLQGQSFQHCHRNECRGFKREEDMLNDLKT